MIAKKVGQDYDLFFDRKNAEIGLKDIKIKSKTEFVKEKPVRLETELRDVNDNGLGKDVVVLFEENKGELGAEAIVSKSGGLILKINDEAWNYLDVYGCLVVPLNGDGIVRTNYRISSVFS